MNQITHPDNKPDLPWSASGSRVQAPDTPMLPGNDSTRPAAVGVMKHAVQGAHDTIDRLADAATPAVQKVGVNIAAAAEAVSVKTHQLREAGDEWVEGARTTVRRHPLASVAAAFALGAVVARIARFVR